MKLICMLLGCIVGLIMLGLGVFAMTAPVTGAAGSAGGVTTSTSAAPTVEATTMAVPAIRGPAPLYAGEAPNSNPQ